MKLRESFNRATQPYALDGDTVFQIFLVVSFLTEYNKKDKWFSVSREQTVGK